LLRRPHRGTILNDVERDASRGVPELEVGSTLDRYVLLERLGAGGMGVVYLGWDPQLHRRVAIKLLHPERGTDARSAALLLREAQAMAQLSHPAVVPVFDTGIADGRVFVVMEAVEGETLADWRRTKSRRWRAGLAMMKVAGRGLAAAHAKGIIHRDFKPNNVLIGRDGRVLVSDFGLALYAEGSRDEETTHEKHPTTGVTATRGLMGTLHYMSPEQLLGKPVDERSDQFSFCVAAYEILYGERPFDIDDESDVPATLQIAMAITSRRIRPGTSRSTVPAWLRRVLLRGLEPDPDARWPTLAALLDELEVVPRRRRRLWIAVASVAAISAITIALVLFRDSNTNGAAGSLVSIHHERGLSLWRGGSSNAARREWVLALDSDPRDAAAALRLGLMSAPTEEGRRYLRQASAHRARLSSHDVELLDASATALEAIPDLARWEDSLLALGRRNPQAGETFYYLAKVRQLRGDADGALTAAAQAAQDPSLRVAAIAQQATIEQGRSRFEAAGRLWDECLASSNNATDCLAGKTRTLAHEGECDAMEQMAQRWIATDTDDAAAYQALAMALAARAAPIESIREAIKAKWEKQSAQGLTSEWSDRYRLYILEGDFEHAIAEARAARDAIPASAGTFVHFGPALDLAVAALASDNNALAAEVAMDFVRRARAWVPDDPRQVAAPLLFLGVAELAGAISAADHDLQRQQWLDRFARSIESSGGAVDSYTRTFPWVVGYAATARTPEMARKALAVLPAYEPLPAPGQRDSDIDVVIGQVFALGGDSQRAQPYLEHATRSCFLFEYPIATLYAKSLLGQLLIERGELDRGSRELEIVLHYWGNARPYSRDAAEAGRALAAARSKQSDDK
jgi:serine/threonine protein kinase